MTALLRGIGAADNIRTHGLPFLPPGDLDLIKLTIARESWPADPESGGYKLSFLSSIEFNFDPTTSMKAALFAQLELQTGSARKESQRVMGRKLVERYLNMCVTSIRSEILHGCREHFRRRYEAIVNRGRRGEGRPLDAALMVDMEEGLDVWSGTPEDDKLSLPSVSLAAL